MSRVRGLRRGARKRPFLSALAVVSLSAGAVGCSPDQTSFFDLPGAENGGAVIYPVAAGAAGASAAALPAGSLDEVSLSSAVDCVAALRVTQSTLSQRGGFMSAQALDAIKQAEGLFYKQAQARAGEDGAGTGLSVAIEKSTQVLVDSPDEAAQQALTCIRTLSGTA
jgi:hypothetical protein